MVDTDGLRTSGIAQSDFRKLQDKETPLGRIAQPEDIALAAVFLASEDARWITGQGDYRCRRQTDVKTPRRSQMSGSAAGPFKRPETLRALMSRTDFASGPRL